jgi:hypothetical protein
MPATPAEPAAVELDSLADYRAVCDVINAYVEGARTGSSAPMKRAFHADAYIFGYYDGEPFNGPIQKLFDWDDANGPAPDVVTHITHVDVVHTVAVARLEIENWTGHRFTDFFTLMKIDGQWTIMNKVFHKY